MEEGLLPKIERRRVQFRDAGCGADSFFGGKREKNKELFYLFIKKQEICRKSIKLS